MSMITNNPHGFVVWWKDLDRWVNPHTALFFRSLPKGWSVVKVGEVVKQFQETCEVEPDSDYRMIGVKWYGEGTFHRETVRGSEISAKKLCPVMPGAFIYNRLFAWKASFAVVPQDYKGCFVSNEFPQFAVDSTRLLTEFLYLYFTTSKVIQAVVAASVGSAAVSRNRFKEEEFLAFPLPLPPLKVQEAIVEYWKKPLIVAADIGIRYKRLIEEIDHEMLKKIGLKLKPPTKREGAFAILWGRLERWDTFFYRLDFTDLENQLSRLRCMRLGDLLNFVSRPWGPHDFPEGFFRYVEISSVTKENGIVGCRNIRIDDAPSRATTLLRTGDVILATTRPYLGAFAIVKPEFDGCVCSSGFAVADRLKTDSVDKDFVLLFLKSSAGLRQLERRMTGGLYPAIVQTKLEQTLVPLPPLELQREIVDVLSHHRERITRERKTAEENKTQVIREVEEIIFGIRPVP